jgi:hypothetical protein
MPKMALLQGAYQAKSVIANAQRCVNLYPEENTGDSPFPTTHYQTPGLRAFSQSPTNSANRGVYRTTTGVLYIVSGQNLYVVSSAGIYTLVGSLSGSLTTPVNMMDNGVVLIIVDGSINGYAVDLATNAFAQIADPSFLGSTTVQYADTYFIFNQPGTRNFYISLSNLTFSMLAGGGVSSGTISSGGSGYYSPASTSTYFNVPLTGGSGAGAVADITAFTGAINGVTILTSGSGYEIGDVLSASLDGTIASGTITAAGSGYTDGTLFGWPVSGGSGNGARAAITIAGGIVTSFSLAGVSQNQGVQYQVGDVLSFSAPDGLGSGFKWTVATLDAPGTGFTYTVDSIGSTAFNSLDIAAKTGFADNLVAVQAIHREIWLIGELTTEVWYNTGAADFTYGIMPGVFIEHGCIAPYSIAKQDLNLFWLSQDLQGKAIVVMGASYQAHRVSTFAIENELQTYSDLSDAIGFTYQQEGHIFYHLTFPTANKTWVYDVTTSLWHERASVDSDGNLNMAIPAFSAYCYGKNIAASYSNGKIYSYDLSYYTDDGTEVPRIRSFPHIKNEDKRVIYQSLIADFECGNLPGSLTTSPAPVSLRWSDDGGVSYSNAVQQDIGSAGQYMRSVKWQRLGLARDRVFELSWSADVKTALNGAFIEITQAQS